ncbi:LOW QUALITY PROTEIN: hypothetical protein QYF61_011611 [Mycteria americana]|uniref:Uncharacterized protein n=1 Tax=Mycteria americana TaxID=33587 RepID=A0AAN7SG40_MYCAM|nr:LOW QUALITY PROTEIN: hypothetical protein QYF61_011611 [Mycteria americana]
MRETTPAERKLTGTLFTIVARDQNICPESQLSSGLHPKQRGQQVEGGDSAPLLPCPETPLEHCVQLWAQDRHGPVGAGPEEATEMVRGLEPLCYGERLRELGLFSLEKRRLRGDLLVAFQYRKGADKKDGGFLAGPVVTGQEAKSGETLDQVAQRSCGCPIIGSVQGQVGWGFEQPDLVGDVPAHVRGVGLGTLQQAAGFFPID